MSERITEIELATWKELAANPYTINWHKVVKRLIAEVRALWEAVETREGDLFRLRAKIEQQRQEIERLKRKQPWRVGEYNLSSMP